jgi:hypothetical protein
VAKPKDIPREPPERLEIGTSEDGEHIEKALGHKGADPERRKQLCRDLRFIFDLYFGPGGELPQVRAPNVDRALAVLRDHATMLQAYLWWGPGETRLKALRIC